jgi:hypothetical protein
VIRGLVVAGAPIPDEITEILELGKASLKYK